VCKANEVRRNLGRVVPKLDVDGLGLRDARDANQEDD
jgi:hypothetical protein